jgi:hypothetical protein
MITGLTASLSLSSGAQAPASAAPLTPAQQTRVTALHALRDATVAARHTDTASSSGSSSSGGVLLPPPWLGGALYAVAPPPGSTPLLVFVNPKSGGTQGARLLPQLQWLLNPRQVFDLMARSGGPGAPIDGPQLGLRLLQNTPDLRIIVCGGDGTVGWVLEALDELGLAPRSIPVGTIPLGTGNDLARALKCGGGYEGGPINKILSHYKDAAPVRMDRWASAWR